MIRNLSLLIFLSYWLCSCSHGDFDYSQYYTINEQQFSYSDTLKYSFMPQEAKPYKIFLSVRYTDQYEFSNLWLKVIEKESASRININLFDNTGTPLGKCTGGVCTQTVFWKSVNLKDKDTTQYNIVQNMRKSPLGYISEVGMIIKSDTTQ
ncbi:MAG: gliding motility lipoprotein GldH [Chitinophagales bacterium]|nr:gliding motility lipoprotein GldH [Chitinophagales bacterium]MCZ2394312.1 gliding motility lipoprotein GldH [Chitinophagales bacterium]